MSDEVTRRLPRRHNAVWHGLVSLGLEVVDYPRKKVLYARQGVCSVAPQLGVRGYGLTLYRLLPDRPVDRTFVLEPLEEG